MEERKTMTKGGGGGMKRESKEIEMKEGGGPGEVVWNKEVPY